MTCMCPVWKRRFEEMELRALIAEDRLRAHEPRADRVQALRDSFDLSPTEALILAKLMSVPAGASHERLETVLPSVSEPTREQLLTLLSVHVHRIRRKGIAIETVWGWGYRLPSEERARIEEACS